MIVNTLDLELLTLQKTTLHEIHKRNGARFTEFAGWDMPLQFSRVMTEHLTVRNAVGLFDVSHMGIISAHSGHRETTIQFLDKMVPRDLVKRLKPGKAVYTQFLNKSGGILDDIIIYGMPSPLEHFSAFPEVLIIMNAANTAQDLDWLRTHGAGEAGINLSQKNDQYSLLALQGPKSLALLKKISNVPSQHIPEKRFHLREALFTLNSQKPVPALVARTGYTGEEGVELIISNNLVGLLWKELLALGEPLGIQPVGLAARDTLRIEAGLPLHGQDISPETSPLEAGLGWSVDLDKTIPFIGQSALQSLKGRLTKQFICFTLNEKTIPRPQDALWCEGVPVGFVTSGTFSPCLNQSIGMGYIQSDKDLLKNSALQIKTRKGFTDGSIVPRPFYKASQVSH